MVVGLPECQLLELSTPHKVDQTAKFSKNDSFESFPTRLAASVAPDQCHMPYALVWPKVWPKMMPLVDKRKRVTAFLL